jgi:hypothetical protein
VLRGADPIAHALQIVDPEDMAKAAWDRRARNYPMYARTDSGLLVKTAYHPDGTSYTPVETYDASPKPGPNRPWKVTVDHGKLNYWFTSEESASSFANRWNKDHPNDPTKRQLSKVADKKATIKKEVPGMGEVISKPSTEHEDPRVQSFAKESLPLIEASDEDIPKELLNILGENHGIGEILSSFAGSGIVLKPNEFRRLILVALGKKALADQLEAVTPEMEEHLLQGHEEKKAPQEQVEEVTPSKEKISRVVTRKIAHLIPGRSYLPAQLYQRTLDILSPMVKVSVSLGGARMLSPAQRPMESRFSNRLQQAFQGADVRSSTMPRVPELVTTLLMTRKLYDAYRTDPQAIIDAFDRPVTMSDLKGGLKVGADEAYYIRSVQGVPTTACVKYAYISPWRPELPGYQGVIESSSYLLRELLAGPLGDHEKRATVVACGVDDLVDAATIIGLRFAGGALRKSLIQR